MFHKLYWALGIVHTLVFMFAGVLDLLANNLEVLHSLLGESPLKRDEPTTSEFTSPSGVVWTAPIHNSQRVDRIREELGTLITTIDLWSLRLFAVASFIATVRGQFEAKG